MCLNMDHFTFRSGLYRQKEGLAMGSPLSPVLANMYMEAFERRALEREELRPKLWWRYVDDTFVVIKKERLEPFFEHLNSLDESIKLTMETETTGGNLPFLDCLAQRVGNRIKTTLYRKPTDTDAVLRYTSAHPRQVFAAIANSLFYKVEHLCTEEEDKKVARKVVTKRLLDHGYPRSLIRRQMERIRNPTNRANRERFAKTACIPYVKGTSEALSRVLNAAEIRVTYKKGQTLRSTLVHLKDKLPVDRTTNCLYKIKCTDCRAAYIGQTARELNTRVNEHKRRIGKRPRNMEDYNKLVRDSAIAEHALDTGHAVDLDNVKVIRWGFVQPRSGFWRRQW